MPCQSLRNILRSSSSNFTSEPFFLLTYVFQELCHHLFVSICMAFQCVYLFISFFKWWYRTDALSMLFWCFQEATLGLDMHWLNTWTAWALLCLPGFWTRMAPELRSCGGPVPRDSVCCSWISPMPLRSRRPIWQSQRRCKMQVQLFSPPLQWQYWCSSLAGASFNCWLHHSVDHFQGRVLGSQDISIHDFWFLGRGKLVVTGHGVGNVYLQLQIISALVWRHHPAHQCTPCGDVFLMYCSPVLSPLPRTLGCREQCRNPGLPCWWRAAPHEHLQALHGGEFLWGCGGVQDLLAAAPEIAGEAGEHVQHGRWAELKHQKVLEQQENQWTSLAKTPRKVLVSLACQYTQGINVKVVSSGFSFVWETISRKFILLGRLLPENSL